MSFKDVVFEPTDASGRFYELRVVYRSELWRSPRLESAFYTRHLKNFKFADLGKYVRLGLSPSGKFDDAGNAVHLKTSLVDGDRMHVVLYVTSAANRTVDQVEIEMTRYVPTDLELAEQRLMARMEQKVQQMGGEKYDMPKLGPGDQYIVYKAKVSSPGYVIYYNFLLFEDYKAVLGTNLELETIEFNDFLRKEIYNYYQQNKIWWTDFINEFINFYNEIWEDSNIRKVINERSLNSNYAPINIISKMCQINTYEDFLSIHPTWSQKSNRGHKWIDTTYFPFDIYGGGNYHLLLSYLASKIHILDIYFQAYGSVRKLFILRSTRLMPNNKKFLFNLHHNYPLVNMPNYSFRKSVNIDGLYEIIDN